MRFPFIVFFVFSAFFLTGQTKISFDFISSFDRGFRSLSSSNDSLIALKDANEERSNGIRYGLNFNYFPNNKIAFKTGIRLVYTGYASTLINENFEYRFIEIPASLRYYYGQNRFRLFSEIGVGIHRYRNGNDNPLLDVNEWHFVGMASMGIDFDYSLDLSFFAQPIFRYHLTETFKNNDTFEEHLLI